MFLLTCFFFLLQSVGFGIWYRFVYQTSNVTFWKFLFNIWRHVRIQLRYSFAPKKCSKKLFDFFEAYDLDMIRGNHRRRKSSDAGVEQSESADDFDEPKSPNKSKSLFYLFQFFIGIVCCVIVSLTISIFIMSSPVVLKVLWAGCGIAAVAEMFIKWNKEITAFLDEYIIFMNALFVVVKLGGECQSARKDKKIRIETIKKNIKEDWVMFVVVLALIGVGISYIIVRPLEYKIGSKQNLVFLAILLSILAFFKLADKDIRKADREKRLRKKEQRAIKREWNQQDGIRITPALSEWEEDILCMCEELRIKKLLVVTLGMEKKYAISGKDETYGRAVVIGEEYMAQLERSLSASEQHDAVAFLLGHELTHIRYKDYAEKVSLLKRGAILCLSLLTFMLSLVLAEKLVSETTMLLLFLLLFPVFLALGYLLNHERYWKQISELRADRIGMKVSRTSPDLLERLLKNTDYGTDVPAEEGIVKKVWNQYAGIDAHPSAELRINELKRNVPWGLGEYFRYFFVLKVWKK